MLAMLAATQSFNLPPGLLSAVCYVESGHRVSAMNHDDGGSKSIGACQIKLATARTLGYRGTEADLKDPVLNAFYAGKYLRVQLTRYNGHIPKAVSAYNAGTYKTVNRKYVDKVFIAWRDNR